MSNLSERLVEIRSKLGLTQGQVAELSGISQAQISRYEMGADITSENLMRLTKAFGVSADFLLGTSDKFSDELAPKERFALLAWRRGDRIEAIKRIVEDE